MDPGDKMGFPPGVCRDMVIKFFESFQNEQWKRFGKKSLDAFKKKLDEQKKKEADFGKFIEPPKMAITDTQNNQTKKETTNTTAKAQTSKPLEKNTQKKDTKSDEDTTTNPVQQKPSNDKFKNISTWNGGINNKEQYSWTQNVWDLTVQIDLPKKCKSKE